MLGRLFSRSPQVDPAEALYGALVRQARRPDFYAALKVPDSLDGRFELIALHAYLLLRRLRAEPGRATEVAQTLVDVLFEDMDRSLRELGVGDLGVGRRVKRMVEAFYGRVAAYEAALNAGREELAAALRRNLFGTAEPDPMALAAMVDYVDSSIAHLDRQAMAELLAGRVDFGPAPRPAGTGETAESNA